MSFSAGNSGSPSNLNPNAEPMESEMIIELPPELSAILRESPERLDEVLGIIADYVLETFDETQHQLQ